MEADFETEDDIFGQKIRVVAQTPEEADERIAAFIAGGHKIGKRLSLWSVVHYGSNGLPVNTYLG